MWGTFISSSSPHTCQVNTTYSGKYQFEIYTTSYPCYRKIGDPFFVYAKQDSDSTDWGLILGTSIPGGVVFIIIIIVIVGATICYYNTRQRRNQFAHGGMYVCFIVLKVTMISFIIEYDQLRNKLDNKPVAGAAKPLTSPSGSPTEYTRLLDNSETHTTSSKVLPSSNTLQHIDSTPALISAQTLQHPIADGTDSLPLPAQASDEVTYIVPTVPKNTYPPAVAASLKKVYVIHCDDSKQWVDGRLKTVLTALSVQMDTIDDAVVGSTISNARYQLVAKADKVILVISPSSRNRWSKENQWSEFELAYATQKDPGSTKITIIPILYGNVKSEDLPKTVSGLVSLRFDAKDFEEKIKESIFYELAASN